jgi:hypothetical protein
MFGNGRGLGGVLRGLFGGSSSSSRGTGRGRMSESRPSLSVSGWVALGGALACFVGGFLAGGHFARAESADPHQQEALHATGQPPDFIGEVRPLSSQAFVVSIYQGVPRAEARQRAKALSDLLVERDLQKARPYEWPTANGPMWVCAVYFDGETEKSVTRQKLQLLADNPPDPVFQQLRKTTPGWPEDYPIQ